MILHELRIFVSIELLRVSGFEDFVYFLVFLAVKILPVVRKQHQLLVTLLLCNAAAMEVQ